MRNHRIIHERDNNNSSILEAGNEIVPNTYFIIIKIDKSESYTYHLPDMESVIVVLKGNCDVMVDQTKYDKVGRRKDIWSGNADSVYAGTGGEVKIRANADNTELAIAGGTCHEKFNSFRVLPEEVEMVEVGSNETKSRRRIYHILGQNAKGRAGNLLISELFCDEGCWSGYPPHKHDSENPPEETDFEETYHYRFNPENGFGGQFLFFDKGDPEAFMTRNGDTFAFRSGYHPTVSSPQHQEYIFTILVGINQRSLIQNFKEEYRYLFDRIPGIASMRSKFK